MRRDNMAFEGMSVGAAHIEADVFFHIGDDDWWVAPNCCSPTSRSDKLINTDVAGREITFYQEVWNYSNAAASVCLTNRLPAGSDFIHFLDMIVFVTTIIKSKLFLKHTVFKHVCLRNLF